MTPTDLDALWDAIEALEAADFAELGDLAAR